MKPTQKSKKGRELNPKYFNEQEWNIFEIADAKQSKRHLGLGAVEIVFPEEAKKVPRNKILPVRARFVWTARKKEAQKGKKKNANTTKGQNQEHQAIRRNESAALKLAEERARGGL